ncbi:VOC family protein [Halioxenophilus aromaticivorans]|uniref:VOC family protein n=1 Tax=Halioxenophilus aromaticivorans TaxID=1306992 RepID=A0AAV3U9R6_9ALTE
MDSNAVCWFEIYVDDMERAKAFYEQVLEVELTRLDVPGEGGDCPQPEMWAFPMGQRPGASGALCKMKGVSAGGNSTLVYFDTEDCSKPGAKVEAAGGKLQVPKMSIGDHGHICVAEDTEGNMIGFHSLS